MTGGRIYYTTIDSPLGEILLTGTTAGLSGIYFQEGANRQEPEADWERDEAIFAEAIAQLQAYFAGSLRRFDLPLVLQGTPFEMAVWQLVRAIPYGETTTYGSLARKLGKPGAARAVGLANGRNPLPIIIPCHRVIGSDGSLTGYGAGISFKEALLATEGAILL